MDRQEDAQPVPPDEHARGRSPHPAQEPVTYACAVLCPPCLRPVRCGVRCVLCRRQLRCQAIFAPTLSCTWPCHAARPASCSRRSWLQQSSVPWWPGFVHPRTSC
jgi:hypothetical protein